MPGQHETFIQVWPPPVCHRCGCVLTPLCADLARGVCQDQAKGDGSLQQPTADTPAVHSRWHPFCSAVCLPRGVGPLQRLPRAVPVCGLCSACLADCPRETARSLRVAPHTVFAGGAATEGAVRCVASTLLPRRRHCECACTAALVGRQSLKQCRSMPAASGFALKAARCRSHAAQPCHVWTPPLKSCRCLVKCCLPWCPASQLHARRFC